MRKIIAVVLFGLITRTVSAESSLSSILDEGGFLNRLRLEQEKSVFSITSEVSDNFFVEPAFKSKEVLIGRLNLKGLLRELYNPDNSTAGASVFSEAGSLTVTDSFSRSSRYGAVLFTDFGFPSSCWLFRANSGMLSTGIAIQEIEPPGLPSFMKLAADFFITAGSTVFNSPGGWFDDKPLIPVQIFANPAIEMRFYAGGKPGSEIDAGRKMMKLQEIPAVSISVLTVLSLPFYTEPGWLIRASGCAGSKCFYLTGNFQLDNESFISPNGQLTDNHLIAGLLMASSLKMPLCDFSFSVDFNRIQKRSAIVPCRYIACKNEITTNADFKIEESGIKLKAEWTQDYDRNGACLEHIVIGIGCKLVIGQFVLSSDYNYNLKTQDGYIEAIQHEAGAEVVFTIGAAKIGLEGLYREVSVLKAGLELSLDELDISISAELNEKIQPAFSVGFNTFW